MTNVANRDSPTEVRLPTLILKPSETGRIHTTSWLRKNGLPDSEAKRMLARGFSEMNDYHATRGYRPEAICVRYDKSNGGISVSTIDTLR